jgi:carboxymethylenebutenolidase
MCYDDDARPPLPPGETRPATGADLVLTAADGNRFSAYLACPQQPSGAQLLIYPDVRGLHQFYKELALRWAEVGVSALALDYFGRTAGLTSRAEGFEFMPHVQQMTVPTLHADTEAALAHLRQGPGETRATFLLGFCRGGTLGLVAASQNYDLAGVIVFYAGLARKIDDTVGTALDVARHAHTPVLGLFGGADQGITAEHRAQLAENLTQAGAEHDIVTYPGAPHSFFDRQAAQFAAESADAWQRALTFIQAHTPA